jgi:acetyl-CoA carboxylase biotin carboxylase subunit
VAPLRVLVANRGEIAVRILRACFDEGMETVLVVSEADRSSLAAQLADRVVCIGPANPAESYLDVDRLVAAAAVTGCDALHPGYGFVSERAELSQACADAGVAFVGPSAEAMRRSGDKATARAAARELGIAIGAGSGIVSSEDEAREVAERMGFPLLLKAAAGGGGRGIRVVDDEAGLRTAFPDASREAASAFGDGRMYLERFVRRARHVEVQVLGDGTDAVHLFERECSLQRRRQKVVEEALAPGIDAGVRDAMTAAAARLAREVGYRSAGTVEFLVDDETHEFFFIEMNTRIQVEHPTTELVTGIDLVTEQLRIASGEPLRHAQDDIVARGWAMEFRVNAEDPARGFLPSPGKVGRVELPAGPWVRVDTWLEPGATVPPFYDSLLAKVVVWGEDRESAIRRSRRALAEFTVEGVATTVGLHTEILDQEWFASGQFHTGTLEQWWEDA